MTLKKIPESVYRHQIKAYSQSQLQQLLDLSPRQWKKEQSRPREETPAMITGTLAHAIALEGAEKVEEGFAVDDWTARIDEKTGKPKKRSNAADYQEFKLKLLQSKKPYIKIEDLAASKNTAIAIEKAWGKNSKSPLLALPGTPEIAIYDHMFGDIPAKGLIDFFPQKHFIIDLKTSGFELDDRSLRKKLYSGWLLQAAFYHDLVEKETGESRVFLNLVCNVKTYETRVIRVDPNSEAMEYGRERYRQALDILKSCLDANEWPGYETLDANQFFERN